MLETILQLLLGWFLISIPSSIIIGLFLSMSKHPSEKSQDTESEMASHPEPRTTSVKINQPVSE